LFEPRQPKQAPDHPIFCLILSNIVALAAVRTTRQVKENMPPNDGHINTLSRYCKNPHGFKIFKTEGDNTSETRATEIIAGLLIQPSENPNIGQDRLSKYRKRPLLVAIKRQMVVLSFDCDSSALNIFYYLGHDALK
jgi:hypothetical protein